MLFKAVITHGRRFSPPSRFIIHSMNGINQFHSFPVPAVISRLVTRHACPQQLFNALECIFRNFLRNSRAITAVINEAFHSSILLYLGQAKARRPYIIKYLKCDYFRLIQWSYHTNQAIMCVCALYILVRWWKFLHNRKKDRQGQPQHSSKGLTWASARSACQESATPSS